MDNLEDREIAALLWVQAKSYLVVDDDNDENNDKLYERFANEAARRWSNAFVPTIDHK